jgi:hypothetical protein
VEWKSGDVGTLAFGQGKADLLIARRDPSTAGRRSRSSRSRLGGWRRSLWLRLLGASTRDIKHLAA